MNDSSFSSEIEHFLFAEIPFLFCDSGRINMDIPRTSGSKSSAASQPEKSDCVSGRALQILSRLTRRNRRNNTGGDQTSSHDQSVGRDKASYDFVVQGDQLGLSYVRDRLSLSGETP